MHHRRSAIVRQHDEAGASLVEYGLLLALIAIVAFSAVSFFGNGGRGSMQRNADCVGGAIAGTLPANCT